MPAVIPFIPLIAAGVSAGGGYLAARAAAKSAATRSPEEIAALQGASGSAGSLQSQGSNLFGTGTGLIQAGQQTMAPATSYFSRLLSGNRALASQAISGPRAAITDVYRGASRSLEQSGVRGAARDVATTDLARQQAGQIGSLITGVQPAAANALTSTGQTQIGQGAGIAGQGSSATSAGGGLFANLLGSGFQNRMVGQQTGAQAAQQWGALTAQLLNASLASRRGASGLNYGSSSAWSTPSDTAGYG